VVLTLVASGTYIFIKARQTTVTASTTSTLQIAIARTGNLITILFALHTRGGKIILAAGQMENILEFSVQDNGQGIPADSLPHIFGRFYRADPARAQENKSGQGLAIARSIAKAHGRSISAESEAGKGTKVSFGFPIG
jgi:signal transduction histidine kinase